MNRHNASVLGGVGSTSLRSFAHFRSLCTSQGRSGEAPENRVAVPAQLCWTPNTARSFTASSHNKVKDIPPKLHNLTWSSLLRLLQRNPQQRQRRTRGWRGLCGSPGARRRVQVLPPFLIQSCSPPSLFYVYICFHQIFERCLSSLPDKKDNIVFGERLLCATGQQTDIKVRKPHKQHLCTLPSPLTSGRAGPAPGLPEVPRPKGISPVPAPLRTRAAPPPWRASRSSLLTQRGPSPLQSPRGRWRPLTAGARGAAPEEPGSPRRAAAARATSGGLAGAHRRNLPVSAMPGRSAPTQSHS